MATGPFGSSIGTKTFRSSGVPVIRGSNLSTDVGKRLIDDDLVFVEPELAETFRRSQVWYGDLIFTCWGTINQVGIIDHRAKYPNYVISNKQMKFTADFDKALPMFLYYWFSGRDGQEQILSGRIGSSVPGFNLGQLRRMMVPLPSMAEQEAIVSLLEVLDDKIDLNRQMEQTLEAMARAIFKDWFVDFGPTHAKVEERAPYLSPETWALFPGQFGPTGVPAGWREHPLLSVASHARDSVNPMRHAEEVFDHHSLPSFDAAHGAIREAGKAILSNKTLIPDEAVLLSKLNPEIPRVWLTDLDPAIRAISSTEFMVLLPRRPDNRAFLYCCVSDPSFRSKMVAMVSGTSKSHQRANPASIMALPVIVPTAPVLAAFASLVGPMLGRIQSNQRENSCLASTRDLLLPKLMSGELRVRDAERVVEAAL